MREPAERAGSDALRQAMVEAPLCDLSGPGPSGAATVAPIEGVPGAALVGPLLSPTECRRIIAASEKLGYQRKVSSRSGPPIRDNQRLLYHAPKGMVSDLASRLAPLLAGLTLPGFAAWRPCAGGGFLNPRWRLNRYQSGEQFFPHFDTGFELNAHRRSLQSLILYLNDDFQGGETVFFPGGHSRDHMLPGQADRAEVCVTPRAGYALWFSHLGPLSPRHAGRPVAEGGVNKYIVRTDLFYERSPWPGRCELFGRDPVRRRCILLMGPPGAGKSTQARRLAAELGWSWVDFGQSIRDVTKRPGPLADELRSARLARLAAQDAAYGPGGGERRPGGWLPDALCHKVLMASLPPSGESAGVVIDGYPRMRSQSLMLEGDAWQLLMVARLDVPEGIRAARLKRRLIDGQPRPEDAPPSAQARLIDWRQDTFPLTEHYAKRGELCVVDGSLPEQAVTDALARAARGRMFRRAEALYPLSLKQLLSAYACDGLDLTSRPERRVYAYHGTDGSTLFVKLASHEGSELRREFDVLRALEAVDLAFEVPTAVVYGKMASDLAYLVTSGLPGISAKAMAQGLSSDARKRALVASVASALRALHTTPPPPGLEEHALPDIMTRAEARLERGHIPLRNFGPKYGPALRDEGELYLEWAALRRCFEVLPAAEPCLVHGDPCLPNFMVDADGQVVGALDLGGMGLGDACRDLAYAAWSAHHNLGSGWDEHLLEAYGLDAQSRARVAFYRRLNRFLA